MFLRRGRAGAEVASLDCSTTVAACMKPIASLRAFPWGLQAITCHCPLTCASLEVLRKRFTCCRSCLWLELLSCGRGSSNRAENLFKHTLCVCAGQINSWFTWKLPTEVSCGRSPHEREIPLVYFLKPCCS